MSQADVARPGLQVLVVDEELPFPLNSGKRIRSFQLLRRLAHRHRITYVAHRNADVAEANLAAQTLRDVGIEPCVVERAIPRKAGVGFYARLLGNLCSPLPYSVATHCSRALQQAILAQRARQAFDVVHCEWTPYAENLRGFADLPPVTIAAHNIESQIWRRYRENESHFLRRWYIGHQWRKFSRFERWAFQWAAQTIYVSEQDQDLAQREFAAVGGTVVENGVDTAAFAAVTSGRNPYELLLMGSLDWRPNIDGIEQFLQHVFPQVRAAEPRATAVVIGRNPQPAFAEWVRSVPGTALHANVPDVQTYTARAGALVVPLRIGGGSRLKILEAAAAGLPILSTAVGAEGLRFQPGVHYAAAQTIDGLRDTILEYFRQPERAAACARAARRLVEEQYDWSILADKLERCWLAVAAASNSNR